MEVVINHPAAGEAAVRLLQLLRHVPYGGRPGWGGAGGGEGVGRGGERRCERGACGERYGDAVRCASGAPALRALRAARRPPPACPLPAPCIPAPGRRRRRRRALTVVQCHHWLDAGGSQLVKQARVELDGRGVGRRALYRARQQARPRQRHAKVPHLRPGAGASCSCPACPAHGVTALTASKPRPGCSCAPCLLWSPATRRPHPFRCAPPPPPLSDARCPRPSSPHPAPLSLTPSDLSSATSWRYRRYKSAPSDALEPSAIARGLAAMYVSHTVGARPAPTPSN